MTEEHRDEFIGVLRQAAEDVYAEVEATEGRRALLDLLVAVVEVRLAQPDVSVRDAIHLSPSFDDIEVDPNELEPGFEAWEVKDDEVIARCTI